MVPNTKKETPTHPIAEVKAKALKVKKAVLKQTKKKIRMSPTF